jgi:hypothetical protein
MDSMQARPSTKLPVRKRTLLVLEQREVPQSDLQTLQSDMDRLRLSIKNLPKPAVPKFNLGQLRNQDQSR